LLVKVGEGDLVLEELTAAKYKLLKQRVYNRVKRYTAITQPYGANRTSAQQQYLRNGYLNYQRTKKGPVFYYAAPDGQSNHQGGRAFDINNWEWVGEQVIKEEAEKLGLRRDPTERWHWNDTGASLASLGITRLEDELEYKDWSDESKSMMFLDMWGGGRQMQNWKGQWVAPADILRATEAIAERAADKSLIAADAVTPGIEGVKHDGATYAMSKYGAELMKQALGAGPHAPAPEVDEAELAKQMLPAILSAIQQLPKDQVQSIAEATVQLLGKTITDRSTEKKE
jgi:hypothetical protein